MWIDHDVCDANTKVTRVCIRGSTWCANAMNSYFHCFNAIWNNTFPLPQNCFDVLASCHSWPSNKSFSSRTAVALGHNKTDDCTALRERPPEVSWDQTDQGFTPLHVLHAQLLKKSGPQETWNGWLSSKVICFSKNTDDQRLGIWLNGFSDLSMFTYYHAASNNLYGRPSSRSQDYITEQDSKVSTLYSARANLAINTGRYTSEWVERRRVKAITGKDQK